ncbi:Uncharacterized protein TPAR_02435 [Tolypocladium paradoxum]|uniref:Acyl-protein thioesterase 1 n=1 Tax=Tolypocladium paradoxum TaxID=94208 RepID=A0A2S4L4K5_9HYPO|nr:Uncharacterized protein TPAR_02435 [Tolypocladium paradoxum]
MSTDAESSPSKLATRKILGGFPAPIILAPTAAPHKLTIIFLHGCGSNATKFHGPLLPTQVAGHGTFREALCHARLVFPTAPLMRATKFRRSVIHQWYDGTGDWEPEARGNMRASVEYVHGMVRAEMGLVGGDARRIVLAGISQGCAMALVSMLLWEGDPLGGVVGMCGFMPLSSSLMETLGGDSKKDTGEEADVVFEAEAGVDDVFDTADTDDDSRSPLQRAIDELREEVELPGASSLSTFSFHSTPVFLGHGTEDDKVEYEHGYQAAALLEKMGVGVDFCAYQGLGHWYSPEMLEHIISFLASKLDVW